MSRRVLVTGAGGFVGANLVQAALSLNNSVVALVRPQTDTWRLIQTPAKLERVDLLDMDALQQVIHAFQPNLIIHSATHGGYPNQKDQTRIAQTNYLTAFNLLNAMLKVCPSATLLNLGSSSEYGTKHEPMKETDLLEPNSLYGASKAAATLLTRAFALEHGLQTFSIRLFSPYGAWEDPNRLIISAIQKALEHHDFPMTSGVQGRDFIFIDDVSRILLSTDFSELPTGAVFNLGSGTETCIFDVVSLIYQITKSRGQVLRGAIPDRQHDSFQSRWQADVSEATKALNWGNLATLEVGIKQTSQWLQAYNGRRYSSSLYS